MTCLVAYGICAAIVAAIAGRRGLSWSAYLLVMLPLGPAVAIIVPRFTQGSANGVMTTSLVFCVPLAALLVALFSKDATPFGSRAESREQKGA